MFIFLYILNHLLKCCSCL